MVALAPRAPGGLGFDPLAGKPYADTGLAEPLANHLASKKSAGRAAKTLTARECYISTLAWMFPAKRFEDFTAFDIMQFEASFTVTSESLRIIRSHVRDFFRWGVVWDLIEKNPVDKLEEIKRRKTKVYDTFEEPEILALYSLPIINAGLFALMFKGGLRKSECQRSQPSDVLASGDLRVLGGKGDKDRLIGMRASLSKMVDELITVEGLKRTDFFWYRRANQGRDIKRDRPIGEGSFYRWYYRCLDEAKVRKHQPNGQLRNPHMTRHTFATRWLQKGGRLETLSMVMGHSSIATTFDLYGHLDQADVRVDLALMED